MTVNRFQNSAFQEVNTVGKPSDNARVSVLRNDSFDQIWPPVPDKALHQYDISKLSGFTDGDAVNTIPDQIGNADLTGQGTYRESGINGNPAIELDGVDDNFDASSTTISTPNTIYAVFEYRSTGDQVIVSFENANGSTSTHNSTIISGNNEIFAGSALVGSSDLTIQQQTAVFDGSNSVLREEGTQTATGDTGSRTSAENIHLGSRENDSLFSDALIGEVVVVDSGNIDTDFESSLLTKWGV